MIVEMSKICLIGLKKDKESILNQLFKTQEIELKVASEFDNTTNEFDSEKYENIKSLQDRYSRVIEFLEELSQKKFNVDIFMTPETLLNTDEKDAYKNMIKVESIMSNIDEIKKEKGFLGQKLEKIEPFKNVPERLSGFKGTKTSFGFLGKIKESDKEKLILRLQDFKYLTYEIDENILKLYVHKSESEGVFKVLSEFSVQKCEEFLPDTAENIIKSINNNIKKLDLKISKLKESAKEYIKFIYDFKVMYDYLSLSLKKCSADSDFRATQSTFFLEGYLAKESQSKVKKALSRLNFTFEYEFLEISKEENPPTIVKNNAIIQPFEFITNTYSPPNSRELDPNFFVFIFFSIFFGFVMADIGYGILFFVICGLIYLTTKKKSGFKSLMGVLSICGVFTIIFGVLFGSFFGLDNSVWGVIPKSVLPNPINDVMTMLLLCLGAGIVQIAFSFLLKGALLLKKKSYLDSIFSGFIWIGFFVGLVLLALDLFSFTDSTFEIGGIILGVSLGVCIIGQIFINKGINRLTKPFSSVYGIINILSDTLSYARLFGLMLSGAIISSIVNDLAFPFLSNAGTFIIGVIILLIGHGFNLFMGALSAYIHVSRLQYIEFFSRFYEGEGEEFVPFSSNLSYVTLIQEKK